MKKVTSILLGLILAASFSLTGCQAGTETSVSKMGNEVEASQPEQTVSDLRIIAEGVPVEVR